MNFCCRHIPCMQKPNYCLDFLDHVPFQSPFLTDNHHHMPCKSFILCWLGQLSSPPLLLTAWHNERCLSQVTTTTATTTVFYAWILLIWTISKNILSLRHFVTNTDFFILNNSEHCNWRNTAFKNLTCTDSYMDNATWQSDNLLITAHCHLAKYAHTINPTMTAARTVGILTMGKTWNIWHPEVYFVEHWDRDYSGKISTNGIPMSWCNYQCMFGELGMCSKIPSILNDCHIYHYNTVPYAPWQTELPQATIHSEITNHHKIVKLWLQSRTPHWM